MTELLDDETVIARLRSALDELAAPDAFATPGDEMPTHSQRTMTATRWMAVAAATVLVAGAVAAIAVNRSNRSDVASTSTTVPPTTPAPSSTPTESTLVRVETKWFALISPDLVAGERTFEECCRASLPGPLLTMAWSSGDTFLTLTEYPNGPTTDVFPDADSTIRTTGSATLLFRSVGLTADERENLADQVVAGSGLPYVLPVEGWGMVALGQTAGTGRLVQMYTPLNTDPVSSYLPTVTVSAGEYRGELDLLGLWPDGEPVTVAGYGGWKVTEGDGTATVFWETGDGNWATLRIDAQLADRADGLIAAVVEVDPTEPTVETVVAPTTGGGNSETPHATIAGDALPAFDGTAGTDPAVGLPAPTVDGFDYDGNEIRIDPTEGPHLVMFQVHWCPHSAANLPDIQQWMADGTIPDWLQVTLVSTAETPDGDNYPAEKWLQELGWTGRVLEDAQQGTSGAAGAAGVAYGATGWPYFVVIGVDGNVLARASGELTVADMEELLAGLPDAPEAIGRLEIPAIDGEWDVVENSIGITGSARLGPVLASGPTPTDLPIGDQLDGYASSTIFGYRTTFGAPFLDLDQLVVGDTLTWTGESGTAIFEVISTSMCPGDEGCLEAPGVLVLTTSDPAFSEQAALLVHARRIA